MFGEVALAVWSMAGTVWWIIAWCLVRSNQRPFPADPSTRRREPVTIFKPLPPLGPRDMQPYAEGLRSFARQLLPGDQMLVGVHEKDRASADAFFAQICDVDPGARIELIHRSEPDTLANPKIAWQVVLAPHAVHALWLWSDTDIVAPLGAIDCMVGEFGPGVGLVTCPYVVSRLPKPAALLETLFVNAEFLPGVLLLRRLGPVDFGLGAGLLFRREDFLERVTWDELGACLADDFQLGQALRPVRISRTTLETVAADSTWAQAIAHDVRWSRTVRWTRPGGSIARILVLPVAGWIAAVILHPAHAAPWVGLVVMLQVDVVAGRALCRAVGCRLSVLDVARLEAWGLWRVLLWILCWLPGQVRWGTTLWRSARAK